MGEHGSLFLPLTGDHAIELADVSDAFVETGDDDFGVARDGPAILGARAGAAALAVDGVNDLAGAAFADRDRQLADGAGELQRLQRTLLLAHGSNDADEPRRAGDAGAAGDGDD